MGGFPARVWSVVRKYVKTSSGRKSFNVLGALNFVTKKIEIITNDTYITSVQVVEMLELLVKKYSKPIAIILDNARYQHCDFVKQNAENSPYVFPKPEFDRTRLEISESKNSCRSLLR